MNLASLIGHVVELLDIVENTTQPVDTVVKDFFRSRKYLGSQDRRFISEAIYGMIRHRRRIEFLCSRFLHDNPQAGSLKSKYSKYLPQYLMYTLSVKNKIAELARGDYAVPQALWRMYIPGVSQRLMSDWLRQDFNFDFPGVQYSFQDWMVQEWLEAVGDETENLLASLNTPAGITLRVNRLKISRQECQDRLSQEGIETEPTRFSPVGLTAKKRFNSQSSPAFKEGWFEIQDEGSQLVSIITQPEPDSIVIDACAGAGGKSLHMAELMENRGEIVAFDVDRARLSELERRTRRAGVDIIRAHLKDDIQSENFFGKADIVLVDAPCSGTGTIRRNPGLKWSVTQSLVDHYAALQKDILESNAKFVKPGGRLVYATCSLLKKENEEIINGFIISHNKYHPVLQSDRLKIFGIESHGDYVQLYPHRHGTDGFFIAVMERGK